MSPAAISKGSRAPGIRRLCWWECNWSEQPRERVWLSGRDANKCIACDSTVPFLRPPPSELGVSRYQRTCKECRCSLVRNSLNQETGQMIREDGYKPQWNTMKYYVAVTENQLSRFVTVRIDASKKTAPERSQGKRLWFCLHRVQTQHSPNTCTAYLWWQISRAARWWGCAWTGRGAEMRLQSPSWPGWSSQGCVPVIKICQALNLYIPLSIIQLNMYIIPFKK